jgi:hypothetical protein
VRLVLVLVLVLSLGAAVSGAAAEVASAGKLAVAVSFLPSTPERAWIALALSQSFERELSRFHRVVLIDPAQADTGHCGRALACMAKELRRAGADVVLVGGLEEYRLRYELYETWSGARVDSGSVFVGPGATSGRLANEIAAIVRPIVRSGGLVDLKPAAKEAPLPGQRPALPLTLLLGVAILVLVSPLVALQRLGGKDALRGAEPPRSLRPAALGISGLTAALGIRAVHEWRPLTVALPSFDVAVPSLLAMTPYVGGIAWAWLAMVLGRWIVPRIDGVGRVRHDALGPLLRAFLVVLSQRLCLAAALLVPLTLLLLRASSFVGLEPELARMLLVPAAGLLVHYWVLALVDHLTIVLDRDMVAGVASVKNPWHATIKRYLVAYSQRLGLSLDATALGRTLFLPGNEETTVVYGGGFTRPRIVIGTSLLELALGPLPAEAERQERHVDLDALAMGLIVPAAPTKAQSRAKRRERSRLMQVVAPGPRGAAPRLIGESVTLLGHVMPSAVEETVPLISNNSEDFAVVRQLLTEHYAAFSRQAGDDDYEGVEILQKDFLFGALVRELGVVSRGESLARTLTLAIGVWARGATKLSKAILRLVTGVHGRFFARHATALADAHAALNLARDHFMQHLHYLRSWREDLLTARGDSPRLLATSHQILRGIDKEDPEGADAARLRVTLRNRLIWMSRFFYSPVPEPRSVFATVLGTLVVIGLGLALLGEAIRQAVAYHPVYASRMSAMQARVLEVEQEKEGAQDGGEH